MVGGWAPWWGRRRRGALRAALVVAGGLGGWGCGATQVEPAPATNPAEASAAANPAEAPAAGTSEAPSSETPEQSIGTLSPAEIRQVIMSRGSAYRECYGAQLRLNPGLEGAVRLRITIGRSGQVLAAQVDRTTLNNVVVEECLTRQISELVFPAPRGGDICRVRYPFRFRPE